MKTRIITAVVATAILIPILVFSDTFFFPLMFGICTALGVFEMCRCLGLHKDYALSIPCIALGFGELFVVFYAKTRESAFCNYFSLFLLLILYFFALSVFSGNKRSLTEIGHLFTTVFYIVTGFCAIAFLRKWEEGGQYVYLTTFICAWVTDTFAYFCGVFFGKHKLIPSVSPKKTIEGSVGGIVFCIAGMIVYGIVLNNVTDYSANLVLLAFGGLVASVVSQIGDLSMSVIKRKFGIKDYGKIFPGHGGILDRFDSVIAVAIVLLVFCNFFSFVG